jgi:hypothetical protein
MPSSIAITPPGIVVAAHVRHPLRINEHKLYSLTAIFSIPLLGLAVSSVNGLTYHRFTSRVPPDIVDGSGHVVALHSEIGHGSTVRIRFINHDGVAVLQAVQIINPQYDNPFAGVEP